MIYQDLTLNNVKNIVATNYLSSNFFILFPFAEPRHKSNYSKLPLWICFG